MSPRIKATVLRLVGIGWFVAICIGGGGLGGVRLDQWLDLSPIFTLLGLAVGIASAVIGMYRMLNAVLSNVPDSKDQRIK